MTTWLKLLRLVLLCAALGSVAAIAQASESEREDSFEKESASYVFQFGELLSGVGAPEEVTFAKLTVREEGNNVLFTLSAEGLEQFVGTPFIRNLAIKFKDDDAEDHDKKNGSSFMLGSVTDANGINNLSISSGGGPGGAWDGQFVFGKGASDRLTDNEVISWTWVGGAGLWDDFALHVQGLSYGGTTSAWYEVGSDHHEPPPPPPVLIVPEPSTYQLFAGALGLLGWVRTRQRRRA